MYGHVSPHSTHVRAVQPCDVAWEDGLPRRAVTVSHSSGIRGVGSSPLEAPHLLPPWLVSASSETLPNPAHFSLAPSSGLT